MHVSRIAVTAALSLALLICVACERETTDLPFAPPAVLVVDLGDGCIDANGTGVVRHGKMIVGTDGPDLIDCRANTTGVVILGRSGFDSIFGGSGNDRLDGGPDSDLIRGFDGNDIIQGGAGDDQLAVKGGLDGGAGDDVIRGGPGVDYIIGGPGDDRLFGQAGADTLFGGDGVDLCVAGQDPNDSEHSTCEK